MKLSYKIRKELLDDFIYNLRFYCPCVQDITLVREDEVEIQVDENICQENCRQKIDEIYKKMSYKKIIKKRELFRNNSNTGYKKNVDSELISKGLIIEFSKGIIGFKGLFLALYDAFDKIFKGIAKQFNATEIKYPLLLSINHMDKCKYISNFGHILTYATHLYEDIEVIKNFIKTRNYRNSFDLKYVLAPAACLYSYISLKDSTLSYDNSPIVLTTKNSCFRYESKNLNSCTRLWDFTMREIIVIGTEEEVLNFREKTMESVKNMAIELNLNFFIETASDPFFLENVENIDYLQILTNLKYELRLNIPYLNSSLAVSSFNIHGEHFSRSFNIKYEDNKFAYTGCTAFGLERWVYGFLSQYGFDINQWPGLIKKYITEK